MNWKRSEVYAMRMYATENGMEGRSRQQTRNHKTQKNLTLPERKWSEEWQRFFPGEAIECTMITNANSVISKVNKRRKGGGEMK